MSKHIIDKEMANSLREMLKSGLETDRELAVHILNEAEFNDENTIDHISSIIGDYNTDIVFDFQEYRNMKSFKFYTRKQHTEHLKKQYHEQ